MFEYSPLSRWILRVLEIDLAKSFETFSTALVRVKSV
jgi:hypothetical protein